MPGNEDLRRELDTASRIKVAPEYRAMLSDLKSRFGHSIRIVDHGSKPLKSFNCFAYAFGIWDAPHYDRLFDRMQNSALMDSAFVMDWLAEGKLTEVTANSVRLHDIVLYFAEDALTHAGRVEAVPDMLMIHSKWGGNEVHEHPLWEVGSEYGDRVRFFRPPSQSGTLRRLEAAHNSRRGMREIGDVNRNNQRLIRKTDERGNHRYALLWEVRCQTCGRQYKANSCDFHIRRCPRPVEQCESGGGKGGSIVG